MIFARSPQAKGRVERTAGTLQDRLVTELRLAGATTIDDANRVLDDFLPRFNERFRVPPEHADTAYRVLDPGLCLDTVLCLKYRRRVGRDNTVKYRWRTLQLLPDRGRPSYAGSVVDVLEGLDGRLAVQHEGRIVASQEAPPRPSILRSFDTRTVHTTVPSRHTNGVIRRPEDEVASMGPVHQRTGNGNALLLSSGHLRGVVSGAFREPDKRQCFLRLRPGLLFGEAGYQQGHLNVLQRRQHRQQVEGLEDVAHPGRAKACLLAVVHAAEVGPGDGDGAGIDVVQAGEAVEQGGLAAAAGPMIATISPRRTSRLTPLRTCTSTSPKP